MVNKSSWLSFLSKSHKGSRLWATKNQLIQLIINKELIIFRKIYFKKEFRNAIYQLGPIKRKMNCLW